MLVQKLNGDSFHKCDDVFNRFYYGLLFTSFPGGCQTNDAKLSVLSLLLVRQKRTDLYLIPLLVVGFVQSLV